MQKDLIERLQRELSSHFGQGEKTFLAVAPGRVNLIGEHTDYNDGFVLPMAIDRHVFLAFRPRSNAEVRVVALDLGEQAQADLDAADFEAMPAFLRYIVGPGKLLQKYQKPIRGFEAVVSSTVPIGGGLSSSAALLVTAVLAFRQINHLSASKAELAHLCAQSERHFSGAEVGIMDPFTSLHGRAGCALLLDCRSLEYHHIPLPSDQLTILVADTRVRRQLSATAYNDRRRACERASAAIAKIYPQVRALRDVDEAMLADVRQQMDEQTYRRARHVVSENARTLQAVQALHEPDISRFGELVNASHQSLRDDYEVSCEELDIMVEAAGHGPGCIGARMMGGGFGGCALVLVRPGNAQAMIEHLQQEYKNRTAIEPNIFTANAADGATVEPLAQKLA